MSLFVDTSAWYAAADRGDRSHEQAKRVLSAGEVRRAASYDADFGVFRFGPGRRLAFEVVH